MRMHEWQSVWGRVRASLIDGVTYEGSSKPSNALTCLIGRGCELLILEGVCQTAAKRMVCDA